MTVLDDGTLVVGLLSDSQAASSPLVADAAPWYERWRSEMPGVIDALVAMPGGRLLVGLKDEPSTIMVFDTP